MSMNHLRSGIYIIRLHLTKLFLTLSRKVDPRKIKEVVYGEDNSK